MNGILEPHDLAIVDNGQQNIAILFQKTSLAVQHRDPAIEVI